MNRSDFGGSLAGAEGLKEAICAFKDEASILHGDVSRVKDCSHLGEFLQRVHRMREELHHVEQGLLQQHLSCCCSPIVKGFGEVTIAVSRLTAKRHGAIIVLQQDDNAEENFLGGTSISGPANAAILENIFCPGSPLHHGAVLIQGIDIV